MFRWLAPFGVLFLFAFPAPAMANSPTSFALVTTAQGCTLYWEYLPKAQTKAELLRENNFSWDGSGCEPGKPIDGYGTLTVETTVDGNTGRIPYRGRIVAGVLDGTIERLNKAMSCKASLQAYNACPWKVYDTQEYRMGCVAGDKWCTPRKALAATPNDVSMGPAPRSSRQPASKSSVAARSKAVGAGANSSTAIPPLRPTITQDAHNPAGEATDCVRVIYSDDFEAEHVSTNMKAVFRNTCSRPVEVLWCTLTGDCKPGYTNLFTVPARKDRGFSYEPSVPGSKVAYAACYNGFVPQQGELSKKLNHACK